MKVVKVEDLEKMFDVGEETVENHFSEITEYENELEQIVCAMVRKSSLEMIKTFRTAMNNIPKYDIEISVEN